MLQVSWHVLFYICYGANILEEEETEKEKWGCINIIIYNS